MTDRRNSAFSLLELVLVLVIIGIALAVVTPSLGGWSRGMRLRSAGDEVLTATRWARDRACTTATPHVLSIDTASAIRVTASDAGLIADEIVEKSFPLPAGVEVVIESADGQALGEATFEPDGSSDAGVLRLTTDRGDVLEIASRAPTAAFAAVTPEGQP